jgi:hypothetical protein
MSALPLDVTISWHILTSCRQGEGQYNIKMELKKYTVGMGKMN